jgi:hypothetical protein
MSGTRFRLISEATCCLSQGRAWSRAVMSCRLEISATSAQSWACLWLPLRELFTTPGPRIRPPDGVLNEALAN